MKKLLYILLLLPALLQSQVVLQRNDYSLVRNDSTITAKHNINTKHLQFIKN